MALSQDEQRILAEIEQRLASDDPGLASSMTAFRRPGPAKMLRSPRVRIVGSLFTVLLVAMVSLTVYAMIPFRAHLDRQTPPASASANTGDTAISATSKQPAAAQRSSASSSTNVAASTDTATVAPTTGTSQIGSTAATASGSNSQQAKVTAAAHDLFPIGTAKP
jgi:cytoskeletal protein RodZ